MPYFTSVERMAFRRAYDQAFEEARLVGLEEARLENRRQARREGQVDLLTCQLTRRFGPLPPEVAARPSAASDSDLTNWGEHHKRLATLEADPNPFALVTAAHLCTTSTLNDPLARYGFKRRLVRLLYRHRSERQRVLDHRAAPPPASLLH